MYQRLRARGTGLITIAMVSLGIAIALRGAIQMLWGTGPIRLPRETRSFYHIDFEIALPTGGALPFDIRVPPDNIFLGLTAVVLVGALYLFLNRTRTGKAMRATADNIDLARITGIDTTRIVPLDMGNRRRLRSHSRHAYRGGAGAAASQCRLGDTDTDVRGGDAGRHRQALGSARGRAAHRCVDGSFNRVGFACV